MTQDPQKNGIVTEVEPEPGVDSQDDLKNRYLRLMADFENVRKRQSTQLTQEVARAKSTLMGDLLPVLDDLARARSASVQSIEQLRDGVEAIERRLLAVLERQGVEKIEAKQGAFDPQLHEALGTIPGTGVPEGHIVEGVRPGYRVDGRLMRPAQVVIAGPGA